jgi:hypothetical protein
VVEFLARRFLETEYLAAGWIDALHNGSYRAVLPGGIHCLEYQQHCVAVTRRKHALQLFQ